jgi:hypothetical protein
MAEERKRQFYSEIRYLRCDIRNHREHLENAPLGPIQKKRLQAVIDYQRAKLKRVLADLKVSKAKK